MYRRVTPPKRATSPNLGPPPPCKQALKHLDNTLSPSLFLIDWSDLLGVGEEVGQCMYYFIPRGVAKSNARKTKN